jgi:hypothetical protein
VLVSGLEEDRIRDCIEKMLALEEDYLGKFRKFFAQFNVVFSDEYASQTQYQYSRPKEVKQQTKPQQVELTNAPWQMNSMEMFPSMGGDSNGSAPTQQPAGVWGRRR